jgi:predicted metal-dependent peptidase
MAKEIKFVGLGPIARYLNESKETDVVDGISNAYGEIKNFKDCDVVFGPDGTRYDPKYICSVVEDSINIINSINEGVIKDFLAALPFVYTFEIPTMATDGKHIFMNPGFIVELLAYCDGSPIGVAFVIIHEVYHNLFKHAEREAADPGKFTDHRKCNRAQDYEINWVIEHSYPDRSYDSEAEANADGETLLDENGNRKQLFTGITNTCKGLFDEKYRSNTWEEIYDMLDNKEEEEEEPQETDIEIDYSDDFKEGMRDGAEDALRILRAQGLVESVSLPFRLLINMTMLNEAKVVMKGTYDDGYKEGYKRVMDAIKGLLNGQQGGGGGGNKGSQPKEVKIDGMPTIKPKFNIPPMQGQSKNNAGPSNPPIELPKSSQQGGEGDSKDSADKNTQDQLGGKHTGTGSSNISQNNPGQQNQQGQQPGGNGGSQGGQSQDGQQNQSGDGNGGGGQGGDQNGQQGQGAGSGSASGSQDGQQGGQQGGGQGGGSQNGQQGDHTGTGGNGQMSTDEAKQKMSKISNTSLGDKDGKAQVIGIAKGGYSGRGGTAAGNHVISEDDGRKLASNAGHDDGSDGEAYAGKSDPFNDKNAVLKALAGLKKASIVLGSNGTPGCGLIDNIGDVLVSLYEPTIDWKKMLKRYMKGYMIKMQDVGYSKKGIIYGRYNRFKDREGESARRILICIDTSGSVVYSGDYLQHIVANVAEITCNLGIRTTNVIQFSDGVYKDTEFTMKNVPPASQFAIKADKSGGTSFMPVFNYIKKNYTDAHKPFQAVIFFTDDDVYSCRLEDPNNIRWSNRVIWMVLSKGEHPLPYGKTINIGPDDFKKQLSFETTDFETEDESEELELENTNESINRNCMNREFIVL